MIGQHDDLHAGFLGVGEHLRPGAAGVRRVFGVGVQDGFVIMQAGQRRQGLPLLLETARIFVGGLEVGGRHPLQGGVFPRGSISLSGQRAGEQCEGHENRQTLPGKRRQTWLHISD